MWIYVDVLNESSGYLLAISNFGQKNERGTAKSGAKRAGDRQLRTQLFDMVWSAGFRLRTKVDGWKQFCKQMRIHPFLSWRSCPGFKKIERALEYTKKAAFGHEEYLQSLNARRQATMLEFTEVPLTAATFAEAIEETFRDRVRWWGG